jgi:hypothetical protein
MELSRADQNSSILAILNFSHNAITIPENMVAFKGDKIVDSQEPLWAGVGSSVPQVVYPGTALRIGGYGFVLFDTSQQMTG